MRFEIRQGKGEIRVESCRVQERKEVSFWLFKNEI